MTKTLELNNQICFPFYAISRKITQSYTPLLNKLDLTYPQYLILLLLWQENWILVKDICEKLYLETNTISPILTTLEKKNIIYKQKNLLNKKHTHIFLTNKWEALKQKAENIPSNLLKNHNFDEKYLKDLHKTLWDFLKIIE